MKHVKLLSLVGLTVLAALLLSVRTEIVARAYISGGWASQKGVGGNTTSLLSIGTGNAPGPVIGMAPAVLTNWPTDVDTGLGSLTTATLNGEITSLNGFPSATVWLEWGLDTNYGTTVGSTTLNVPGTFNFTLQGYPPATLIHYRAASQTDGVSYGIDRTFHRKVLDAFSGVEYVAKVTPLLLYVLDFTLGIWLVTASVRPVWQGQAELTANRTMATILGMVMIAVAIFLLPIIIAAVDTLLGGSV